MRKRCCIESCAIKIDNECENRRQFFKFPSDQEKKCLWLQSIGGNLGKGRSHRKILYICNVHFAEDSFHNNALKILKDGCETEVPRKRLRLKEGSLPTIFEDDSQNQGINNTVSGIEASPHISGKSTCLNIKLSENSRSRRRDLSPDSRRRVDNLNKIMSFSETLPPCEKDSVSESQKKYTIQTLIHEWNSRNVSQFPGDWGINTTSEGVLFGYIGDIATKVTRSIFVKKDMTVEIMAHNHLAKFPVLDKLSSLEELRMAMIKVTCLQLCERAWKGLCRNGYYIPKAHSSSKNCKDCQVILKREKRKQLRAARRLVLKSKRIKNNLRKMKERLIRTEKKMESMQEHIDNLMEKCSAINQDTLLKGIEGLPKKQRAIVKTIFQYSTIKDKQGMRYTREWILECIVLSIKSRRAYLHLRNNNILPLPTLPTLRKYLKHMKPRYGFDPQVFSMLKKKGDAMKTELKRGVLVVDEMQISKSVSFDSENLSVLGFTDLGDHTPQKQKNQQADHALVFLFQPFRGKWVQNVAAFLSKGAANGEVLSHLTSECIILLENHGFHVDVVTTDGAQWNRGMWTRFGLKNLQASCRHVCCVDETNSPGTRRLWFCSDFSHLVKNFRNFMLAKEEVMTPDGIFKKKHFRSVLKCDGGAKCLGLKIAHKLTEDHLDPKFFEKMHVHKAFEVFSSNVSVAMNVYKKFDNDLIDCEPTIKVINRVRQLITAMTSRSSQDSLTPECDSYDTIIDFVKYLRIWRNTNKSNGYVFMSSNTYNGFEVTLKTTLEVMKFLVDKCKFSFLMTARLNQDALEGMFGMIRGCCGSHNKPDPLLFIQIYRLLSFYSLVKPPKGSNVEGSEIFETLLSAKDTVNENKEEWKAALEHIIERGEKNAQEYGVRHAHDYTVFGVNDTVLAYFSGFVARKISKWTSCIQCVATASKPFGNLPRDEMINGLSRGYLVYPSDDLFNLLFSLERAILQTIGEEELNFYTFQHIVNNILAESITFVGCEEHKTTLTKSIINYYCVTRMHIICKKHNNVYNDARKEEKKYRKLAKLVGNSKNDDENYTDEKENKGQKGKGKKRKSKMVDTSDIPKKRQRKAKSTNEKSKTVKICKGQQKKLGSQVQQIVPRIEDQKRRKVVVVKGNIEVLKTVPEQNVEILKEQERRKVPVRKGAVKVLSNVLSQNVLLIKEQHKKLIVVQGEKKLLLTSESNVKEMKKDYNIPRI